MSIKAERENRHVIEYHQVFFFMSNHIIYPVIKMALFTLGITY